jgi:hypothetical protein
MAAEQPNGFIRNCFIAMRPGDSPIFELLDGQFIPRLEGYVICPREMLQEVAASERAKDANG